MKIINILIAILLTFSLIYLVYIYNVHEKWNKVESILFIICLLIGSINAFILIYRNRKKQKNINES